MDDFGAGFSSLDVLQRFCFDKVKIDRSFAARLPASSEARALLRALLDMASALQITAVLEGVETAAQLALARSEGCAVVQGYLHSAPVAAAEVPGVIATIEGSAPRLRGRFGLRRLAQGPSGAVVGGSSGSM
jgi:EAL domain-containing protein (putative c-di-GMP-specific phosphodiesterase class I)